jgi:D-alanyl-D-alanine carboxypeptidase/D-alanyl-D-alanine-endopeptidase (penicillin-binding protein 4)
MLSRIKSLARRVAQRPWTAGAAVVVACGLSAAGALAADAAPGRSPAPPPLLAMLAEAGVSDDEVGLLAAPVDGGAPLASWNHEVAFNPASTMKLLTTYAALAMLGQDYRWRTEVHLGGPLSGDTLYGDLVVRGGGDPKLVIEDMLALVARMRAAGLREIRGDLIVDDALYALGKGPFEPFDGDASQPYNVTPFPALMNFKSTRFVFAPARGGRVAVELDPPLADVRIVNEVRLQRGRCRYGADGLRIADESDARRAVVRISGRYSAGCGRQGIFAAVLDHRQFIHGFFKAAWLQSGGTWNGVTRVVAGAARGEPWLVWESPRTLAEVAVDVNKTSNNVMTRQLLLQVAADVFHAPATIDDARRAVRGWLEQRGLDFPELVLDNGSGLSRTERISAANQVRLLRDAAASPYADLFRASLPIAGVDGTMRYRLRDHPVSGHAWIKTGSLVGVRAIAGYVDAASGRRYAVSMLVNGPQAKASRAAQDEFIRWVYING